MTSATPTDAVPRVRAVVVNFNGGGFVDRCVDALRSTAWPEDHLEIVVVDNASSDGSGDHLERDVPGIRLLRSATNLGFAAGSNLGIGEVREVDYVALVNSDAFVDPGWLAPLVDALEQDPRTGAASPKLVFEPKFVEISIETDAYVPDNGDTRELGVLLSGVRADDACHPWRAVRFPSGFYDEEPGGPSGRFRWSKPSAVLHAPVAGASTRHVTLQLSAVVAKDVTLQSRSGTMVVRVGPDPVDVVVPLDGSCFDVVNNAGSLLLPGGHGADRGFGEEDRGQYETVDEVFAWCGAAVVLSRDYLLDVGLFDPDYFLYYEDFDLSWRARSRGWKHVYVAGSVVRHRHTASTVEGSALFNHFVQRNRLLTLAKNAPGAMLVREVSAYAGGAAQLGIGELVRPYLRGDKGHLVNLPGRLRSLAALGEHLPTALRHRRAINARRTVPASELLEWTVVP